MPYVLTDNEYADFVQMRKLYLSGRDNGGNASGPVGGKGRAFRPGDSLAIIEITGNESGGEIYTCDAYLPAAGFLSASGGNTAANARGTLYAEDAVFINLQGIGQSTHELTHADNTSQKFFVGLLIGVTTADSRPIYVGNALWTTACP